MGKRSVDRLRARFERDGWLEFRLRPAKVALHVSLFVVIAVGIPVFAWTQGAVFAVLAIAFAAWFVPCVGFVYAEQLLGAGPPLRVDRQGLSLRRWREPLVLRWSDVLLLVPFRASKLTGPLVGIALSQWVWHDYRTSRPRRLRLLDRLTHYSNRCLVQLKVLDASAADILSLLDPEAISRLTTIEPPHQFVLDVGLDGESPLWFRGGREVPLAQLPLSPAIAAAVTDWNDRVVGLLEQDRGEELTRAVESTATAGRSLAIQLQSELGPGARVLFTGDVPR